jgi:DHA1 family tetracycline resistance protein-like MFS transporter
MRRSPLLPIFLIVLVDVLGFTIVIPLLPLYAETLGATPLIATCITSVYAVCSLLSTPVIGNLSDKFGRKRLLLLSQAGTCAGFFVLAGANALWMVFLGRIIDGITAGNLALAQAYISDHTKPEDRAKSFGIIGIAFGLGFMVGPGLGGYLGHIVAPSPLAPAAYPFLLAAALSATSMLCTRMLLTNERPPQADPAMASGPGGRRPGAFDFATYLAYFRRPGLGNLYLQFFLFTFSFSCFTSGMALFMQARFNWDAQDTGILFTYSGFLGIIWQGGVIGRLVKRFGDAPVALAGMASAAVAYVVMGLSETVAMLVVAATMSSFGNGVIRPVLTAQITKAVGRHEQGVALGISGSLSSFAMVMAPPTGGLLLDHAQLTGWARRRDGRAYTRRRAGGVTATG